MHIPILRIGNEDIQASSDDILRPSELACAKSKSTYLAQEPAGPVKQLHAAVP